jgi:molecular chaperone GrpE
MSTHDLPNIPPDDVEGNASERSGQPLPDSVPDSELGDPESDIAAVVKKLEDEKVELKDAWMRARADIENVRKQAANDVSKAYKYAIEKFVEEMLPVKDSLESALGADNATPDALRSGVELTLKQLAAAFDKAQIKEVAPVGAKFDPHQHQAMAMVDSDQAPNTVVTVLQKGYRLNERVLRPALVAVAKAKATGQ